MAEKIEKEQKRTLRAAFAEELMQMIRERDPHARFTFGRGPDRGIWVLDAFVTPELAEDQAFHESLADRAVDIAVEHGVHIATVLQPNTHAAQGAASGEPAVLSTDGRPIEGATAHADRVTPG